MPFRTTIDSDVLKKLKIKALDVGVDVNDILEQLSILYLSGKIKDVNVIKKSKK